MRPPVPQDEPGGDVWSAVLAAALDCIIVMDAQGLVREFNPSAERTFGWSRAEAVGQTLAELIVPPELRARHVAGLKHYLRTGEGPVLGKRIEIAAVRKDGSRLPVELAIVPFQGAGERLFAGYLRDLSERERIQKELQRRNDLAKLLQEIPLAASAAHDLDEAVRLSVDAVRRFMGWPLGHAYFLEADGRLSSHGLWSMADPERFQPFRAATERTRLAPGEGLPGRVLASGKPAWIPDLAHDPNFPRNRIVKDHGLRSGFGFPVMQEGQVRVVLEFFSPAAEQPQDDVLAVLQAVGRELGRVLGRLEQEARLKVANERLSDLARARQDFLNQAAHELGGPLTPIVAQLRLLEAAGPDDKTRARLAVVQRNVDRLRTLAQDLLDAARVESGRLALQPHAVDLADLARQAVAAHADLAREAGIALQAQAAGPVPAYADAGRVGQVLDNLIANALRFTDRGGRVEVAARAEDGAGVLAVRDSGIGLAPEALARLFQAFTQVHDRAERNVGGTGLGLFISRGIAQASGGQLTAASPGRGQGTTFTLRLPSTK